MTRLLRDAGEALYGPRWQTDLSRDLGVSDRTMRRWAAGADAPPPGVYVDLMRLASQRIQALEAIQDRLRLAELRRLRAVEPPPAGLSPDADRDGPCGEALDPHLDDLRARAEAAGWHPKFEGS